MSRNRAPEHDYICRRCGCACEEDGTRHLGGGPGMKACRWAPDPVLRAAYEAEIAADIAGLRAMRNS